MTTIPPLSDFLNVMFTGEHLFEIIRLGNSARKRLAIVTASHGQCEIPPYLWFIHPRYLIQFVALGQQAQMDQDAQRVIGLEAAMRVLSFERKSRSFHTPILDFSSTPTTAKPITQDMTITGQSHGITNDPRVLKGKEYVTMDVAIWIIDHLRCVEGYCTRCSHGVTVNEYGGGYFHSTDISNTMAETHTDIKADYAITYNSQGGLSLYQM
ncbi:hypothetical protein COCC4DRAFT_148945 [Bipolaris maydis ATCC 48331]|uniref:Uncharacterized protein n=2 Tax=Cochliobolus heterostrophus TaxID=5016 RepID=M2UVJ9_COCH5|nr:uncharacterized protein COCC4DRAFT_148945 [Bipolaris maydis ATCC 48331]EMD97611.1 hypothetical protein COCHEDRAFT_1025999 [Bipolaris maydis C5]KAJ5031719.1 hypothetical protein J3E73DRAFT_179274 [Bipolaris maydis]ENI01109.1 hypothetical protein COCC4DRAFT_148945 [Bipolaris maydis ATCC 48331]KAJ6211027.1 hypothetical protein PSV09DRAFT_1025999 [Bipolaris maydis]KAJ6273423.1 hypothetical protein PSV08DRAFT_173063 [Bipolaris maydis]